MMKTVEDIAAQTRMTKVCLTVLIENVTALKFYHKLGYTNNEKLGKDYSYRILSKAIKVKPEGVDTNSGKKKKSKK